MPFRSAHLGGVQIAEAVDLSRAQKSEMRRGLIAAGS